MYAPTQLPLPQASQLCWPIQGTVFLPGHGVALTSMKSKTKKDPSDFSSLCWRARGSSPAKTAQWMPSADSSVCCLVCPLWQPHLVARQHQGRGTDPAEMRCSARWWVPTPCWGLVLSWGLAHPTPSLALRPASSPIPPSRPGGSAGWHQEENSFFPLSDLTLKLDWVQLLSHYHLC